jgi:hypothetical protein
VFHESEGGVSRCLGCVGPCRPCFFGNEEVSSVMKSPDAFRDRPMMIDAITPFDPCDPADVRSIRACEKESYTARVFRIASCCFTGREYVHGTGECRIRSASRSCVRSMTVLARGEGARAPVHNPFRKYPS